ncbi:MAG: 50S ribosomal protein L6 [Candidatus Rokubacteria bacterium CSP1-6]|nr:MAG: 50S ribosomal protein L6 [Candidatus Rokubacteria bacterium CSP1-6]
MSRIGRKPIPIPTSVRVAVEGPEVRVEGPKGKLSHSVPGVLTVEVKDGQLQVGRTADHRSARALHGLTRSLLANMVQGVSQGFEKKLEIVGIGYRAQLQGKNLQLALGYSHPVVFPLPEGIQAEVERNVLVTLRGADKGLLGQTAARLRSLREPDPYKGKGVKYADEVIRRKVGKKAGAAAATPK